MLRTFLLFLRMGCLCFGGPVAHLGHFRQEFVVRRRLLEEADWGEMLAICQFLPGPTSSQVGILLGRRMAGTGGAVAAWLGFTLPSALLMTLLAWAGRSLPGDLLHGGWAAGLRAGALAVVLHAVIGMARTFWKSAPAAGIGAAAMLASLCLRSPYGQLLVLTATAVAGSRLLRSDDAPPPVAPSSGPLWKFHATALAAMFLGLPALVAATGSPLLGGVWALVRAGGLVFGGGHVALPFLRTAFVPSGWISNEDFLVGYGLVQTMPGPLFAISSWLGALSSPFPGMWSGSVIAIAAIYLPSVPLLGLSLKAWDLARTRRRARAAVQGICAGSTGLLAAALVPLGRESANSPLLVGLALAGFLALWNKAPAWSIPLGCAAVTALAG